MCIIRRAACLLVVIAALGAAPPTPRVDLYGDVLPDGAIARLGMLGSPRGAGPVLFLPDGKTGILGLQLFDLKTGRVKSTLSFETNEADLLIQLACSPDGKRLAGAWAAGFVRVWNLSDGQEIFSTRIQDNSAKTTYRRELAFSPDGEHLYVGGGARALQRWDLKTRKQVPLSNRIPEAPPVVRVAPDGKRAALIHLGHLSLWDLQTGAMVRQLDRWPITTQMAWSPDGKILCVCDPDNYRTGLHLYDVDSGRSRTFKAGTYTGFSGLVFSHDGKQIAAGGLNSCSAAVWDVATGKATADFSLEHDRSIFSLAFTHDGRPIVSTRTRGLVDLSTRKGLFETSGHHTGATAVVILADGNGVLTTGEDGTVRLWDVVTSSQTLLARNINVPRALAASPNGILFAVGGPDEFRVYKRQKDGATTHFSSRGATPLIAFSADGKHLVTGNTWLHVWDVATGREIISVRPHGGNEFSSLAVSADSALVATGGRDGHIHFWRLADGRHLGSRQNAHGNSPVRGLAFLPDGRSLMSCGMEGVIRIWEVASREERLRYSSSRLISQVVLSADGKLAAFPTTTGHLGFWYPASGASKPHSTLAVEGADFAVTPDFRRAVTNTAEGVLVWNLQSFVPPRTTVRKLSGDEVAAAWALLVENAAKAYPAVCELGEAGDEAIAVFAKHLKPIERTTDAELKLLIAELDSEIFADRQAAATKLARLGDRCRVALEAALKGDASLELRRQAKRVLERLDGALSSEELRAIRAIEVMERIGSEQARALLKKLADGETSAPITQHAVASLARLKVRDATRHK